MASMENVYDVLKERGFIQQVTDEELVASRLREGKVFCYIGFDPTAKSLHIGSLVPIMALMHMQRYGHRPIVLLGGGTALIGDPSGKTEMRRLLTIEQITANALGLKQQLSRYLDFSAAAGALLLNNADWLVPIKYIEFLRDIGRHFSVNKMLTAESYRLRLEKGLNFIEFNYMLLQAYDFLHLFDSYGCVLQMGGNDQWGNILAGTDLIRRVRGADAFGVTFPLLTTASGHKMGKTERGTLWLGGTMSSPYDYYQYWVNIDDADLQRFLLLFTFLPTVEVAEAPQWRDAEINMAKAVLAFETTKITHGEAAALAAWRSAAALFGKAAVPSWLLPSSSIPREAASPDFSAMPFVNRAQTELKEGIPVYKLFVETGLCTSGGEARRLVAQGGAYLNERQIKHFDEVVSTSELNPAGEVILRKGKKTYMAIKFS